MRATLKRVFGVDFDEAETPIDTHRLPDPEKSKDLMSKPEWSALETPFAGMTERKQKQAVKLMFIPLCSFSLRRAYDGGVFEDELQACARRFVAAFEAELGEKIPRLSSQRTIRRRSSVRACRRSATCARSSKATSDRRLRVVSVTC